jgi:phage replication-related protein YjqB (UPF0714/DUF867 family)
MILSRTTAAVSGNTSHRVIVVAIFGGKIEQRYY